MFLLTPLNVPGALVSRVRTNGKLLLPVFKRSGSHHSRHNVQDTRPRGIARTMPSEQTGTCKEIRLRLKLRAWKVN